VKEHFPKSRESILNALLNKYQADPEGFHSYLPEVAQELEQLFPSRRRNSHRSALTELERERLHKVLLQLFSEKTLSSDKAIQALEYCATLIQDESLPPEVDRKILLSLLHQAIGVPFSKVKKITKIPVHEGEAIKEVALLRGVHLHLTWNDHLVAISISPMKLKERSRALRFVGIAQDAASDVAQNHDAYLAKEFTNAAS
jgi:hypothetical protein